METLITLLLFVFAAGIISRILWRIWCIHILGRNLGIVIKNRLPLWWESGLKLISYKPENLSLIGVLGIVLWPCLTFLNVMLLAQVLELFFPGGKRILLPWVGSYSIFPLIMGALYALSQTIFGIMFVESTTRRVKIGLGMTIFVAIAAEAGLAAYRAWLISIGEEPVSPSLWDLIMIRVGPILAGGLGTIVPLAELCIGTKAFKNGLEPLAKASLHYIGGVFILVWCATAWWLFGHQEFITLPTTIDYLKKKLESIKRDLQDVKPLKDDFIKGANILGTEPLDFATLDGKIDELKRELDKKNAEWSQKFLDIEKTLKNVSNSAGIMDFKRKVLRNFKEQIVGYLTDIELKADALYKEIKKGYPRFHKWIKMTQRYNMKYQEADDNAKKLEAQFTPLKIITDEISQCLGKQSIGDVKHLLQAQIKELKELNVKAMGSNPSDREDALNVIRMCQEAINEANGIGLEISGFISTINKHKGKLPINVPQIPPVERKEQQEAQVLRIEDDIHNQGKIKKTQVYNLYKDLKLRACQLGMPWYRRLLLTFIIFIIILPVISYSKIAEGAIKEDTPRFIIVLLDETSSFGLQQKGKIVHFWPEVIPWVNKIVDKLEPGDGFGFIGIDDHGFDTDDIRISLEVLDPASLRALRQKRELKKRILSLQRREGAKATDIQGAMQHAAYLLNNQGGNYQGVLVVFSDMLQNVGKLANRFDSSFPEGTKGYFFYVNATGKGKWDNLIKEWMPTFKGLNLDVQRPGGKIHFYQKGEMGLGFKNAFAE